MEAKGFVSNLERLLVAVDDSANGQFGSRTAGKIAGVRSMPTTIMHITKKPTRKESSAAVTDKKKERAEIAAQILKDAVAEIERRRPKKEKSDQTLDVTVIPGTVTKTEVIAEEAEKGYDLLLIGLDKTTVRDNTGFHTGVNQLAAGFEGPLIIVDARDGLLKEPSDSLSILVPVNGTETSRRAAEVAIAIARASRAPITSLYVAPPRNAKRPSRRRADAILKDIVALGETYNVDARTAVRSDAAADEAILKEMTKRKHNLIVMGVERRPGEKLFFGETAAGLLEKSDRSIVFVVA
jgi:nucleotide-binding universal stress UspA family protein